MNYEVGDTIPITPKSGQRFAEYVPVSYDKNSKCAWDVFEGDGKTPVAHYLTEADARLLVYGPAAVPILLEAITDLNQLSANAGVCDSRALTTLLDANMAVVDLKGGDTFDAELDALNIAAGLVAAAFEKTLPVPVPSPLEEIATVGATEELPKAYEFGGELLALPVTFSSSITQVTEEGVTGSITWVEVGGEETPLSMQLPNLPMGNQVWQDAAKKVTPIIETSFVQTPSNPPEVLAAIQQPSNSQNYVAAKAAMTAFEQALGLKPAASTKGELKAFIAMLSRAWVGHGTRTDYNPPGTGVQVECENGNGIFEFWFDEAGALKEVYQSVGDPG